MSLPTSIAIYFIIWWVVRGPILGCAQPTGAGDDYPRQRSRRAGDPSLKRKLLWTTIVAAVVFAIWHVVYSYRLIALDDLARLMGVTPR
jgi:predicted secreted protein